MCPRVHQEDETKLKGTVNVAAGQSIEVTPSGDMARKHPWDRDPTTLIQYYGDDIATSGWTVRSTYTVPADRKIVHSLLFTYIIAAIATATKTARVKCEISTDAGDNYAFFYQRIHSSLTIARLTEMLPAPFYLNEAEILRIQTYNNDTIAHFISATLTYVEFDE